MKKIVLAITLLSLSGSPMVYSMENASAESGSSSYGSSLKKVAKVLGVGMLLFGSQSAEAECTRGGFKIVKTLPYAPVLPENNVTCCYRYALTQYEDNSPFGHGQEAALVCQYGLDKDRLNDCYIEQTCDDIQSKQRLERIAGSINLGAVGAAAGAALLGVAGHEWYKGRKLKNNPRGDG